MSVTITVSEETFRKLEDAARSKGKASVEQSLDDLSLPSPDLSAEELVRRKEVVREIREFRNRMKDKYGVMPDSTPLIREDRER